MSLDRLLSLVGSFARYPSKCFHINIVLLEVRFKFFYTGYVNLNNAVYVAIFI